MSKTLPDATPNVFQIENGEKIKHPNSYLSYHSAQCIPNMLFRPLYEVVLFFCLFLFCIELIILNEKLQVLKWLKMLLVFEKATCNVYESGCNLSVI